MACGMARASRAVRFFNFRPRCALAPRNSKARFNHSARARHNTRGRGTAHAKHLQESGKKSRRRVHATRALVAAALHGPDAFALWKKTGSVDHENGGRSGTVDPGPSSEPGSASVGLALLPVALPLALLAGRAAVARSTCASNSGSSGGAIRRPVGACVCIALPVAGRSD